MQSPGDKKLPPEAESSHPMTLHCLQCNTVLGDSLAVCGEIQCLDSVMCLSKFRSLLTTDSLTAGVQHTFQAVFKYKKKRDKAATFSSRFSSSPVFHG